jgi:hypothetical protein
MKTVARCPPRGRASPANADAAKGGVTKVAPSRLATAESGLTRATATGMTLLPHSDNVLNECQAEHSQGFLAAATILGRGTRLFLLH